MSAAGKVLTGFSSPYVAKYASSSGVTTYSAGQVLARGVSVSIEAETGEANNFYADNIVAESVAGRFNTGTLTLTVDGLLIAAQQLIEGVEAPTGSDVWTKFGANAEPPYVGVGFVARYMSDGVTYYTPIILPKCVFAPTPIEAATQEDEIEFQTQELTATIFRDDTADQNWKWIGPDQATLAAATALIETAFNINTSVTSD